MILSKVRIQNFKSVQDTGDLYLPNDDLITILAGQNESGKTSFLKALKFFQEGFYSSFDEDDRRLGTFPKVECTFQINHKEYLDLKKITSEKVAKYFLDEGIKFLRGEVDEDQKNLRYLNFNELEKVVTDYNTKLQSEAKEGESYEEFNPYDYFLKILPKMVYYSSFGENILPGKINYNEIPNNQAVQDFQNIYEVDFQKLLESTTSDPQRETDQERIRASAAESLNTYWKQKISGVDTEYKFSITIRPQAGDHTQGYINFFVNQGDNQQLKISQKSQGFQWFVGFNLRLKSHESLLKEDNIILLIDEPGQGLHEVAQQDLKNIIEELAKVSGIQIIYTTHQPTLLGKENIDFNRLLLVERDKNEGTTFKSIGKAVKDNGASDSLSPIRSAIGMVTLTDPLSDKKITIVTEGICEYYYFKAAFGDEYAIIPSRGASQIPHIFTILYGWGIPAIAIFDDDVDGDNAYQSIKKDIFGGAEEEIEKQIFKIPGAKGIEEILSEKTITDVLNSFSLKYKKTTGKAKNTEQPGSKTIFAKSFYETYKGKAFSSLDKETKDKFKLIEDFIKKSKTR